MIAPLFSKHTKPGQLHARNWRIDATRAEKSVLDDKRFTKTGTVVVNGRRYVYNPTAFYTEPTEGANTPDAPDLEGVLRNRPISARVVAPAGEFIGAIRRGVALEAQMTRISANGKLYITAQSEEIGQTETVIDSGIDYPHSGEGVAYWGNPDQLLNALAWLRAKDTVILVFYKDVLALAAGTRAAIIAAMQPQ
jgi:hypothetical protein